MAMMNAAAYRLRAAGLFGAATLFLALTASTSIGAPLDSAEVSKAPTSDLAMLSLEDLMSVKVASASRHLQRLTDTAAAVYVITQEDIRRSGLNSIPELLRLVPGMEVQRTNSNQWSVTCRGFNGAFANKLLVMIDGRSVYSSLYAGVYWDVQDTLLEDIDRIEVIRGPGATMWGANAVNGIVNVITKSAADTQAGLFAQSSGGERVGLTQLRYGGQAGNGSFRAYMKDSHWGSFDRADHTSALDDWNQTRAGFRADFGQPDEDSLTVQGDVYSGTSNQLVAVPSLTAPYVSVVDDAVKVSGGNTLIKWSRATSDTSNTEFQAYFDHTTRESSQYGDVRSVYDLDFQRRSGLGGSHELTWGLGYRYDHAVLVSTSEASWTQNDPSDSLYSAFIQDEISLRDDHVHLTAGSKFEHNDYSGFEVQPNIRVLWNASSRSAGWASVSRAVRTPSQSDTTGRVGVGVIPPRLPDSPLPISMETVGNPAMESEKLTAYELGYRVEPSDCTSLDLTTFYNVYTDVRTHDVQAPYMSQTPLPHLVMPMVVGNSMHGTAYGAELATNWIVNEKWRVAAGLTKLLIDMHNEPPFTDTRTELLNEQSSPRSRISLSSYLELPGGLQLDTMLFYYSQFASGQVPATTRLDVRLGWTPHNGPEVSVGAQNLVCGRHREYGFSYLGGEAYISPDVYGTVSWRF